ncbi:MAG: PAS domain S-box protein [Spirochaetota bacterium]|nr:MAG: PAS domain S-box protein [Spirochaetota bacterium]
MIFKRLLGQILVDLGHISSAQLENAVLKQKELFDEKALPERIERDKIISEARVVRYADTIPLFGKVLIDMKLITEEQLSQALKEQSKLVEIYSSLDTGKLGAAIETGYVVNSTLNIAEVLAFIMRYVNRVTNSVASTLMLLDHKTGELIFSVPTGPKADKLTDVRLPSGKGIAGWVAEHEKYALVPDVKKDERFYPEIDKIIGFETKSILCVPLKAKTRLIGVLEVINKADGSFFTEQDAVLLGIFAYQVALAIENARLYGEIKDQMNELLESAEKRRKAEEGLRESEQRFRDLFEYSPDAIFVEDLNGKVLDVNPAACRLHGQAREELIGEDVYKLIPPERREKAHDEFSKLVKGEYDHLESYSLTKDAKEVPVEIRARRIEYSGKPALLLMVRDITERKRAEAELLRASKLDSIGTLAGGIAHDFNNLLTAILGNISLLMSHLEKTDPIYDKVAEAEKASLRARDLTQQLLTFSKGGSPVKQPSKLGPLLRDAAQFALSGSNVRPRFALPEDIWTVEIDEGQINQVINNIIINADHAMPEGGTVELRAKNVTLDEKTILPLRTGKYVKVSIKDTGIGIQKEHLEKIFDPYFSTKSKGLGLGLSTTYSILKNHGGHVTVESELGKGTSFFIYLPAIELETLEEKEEGVEEFHREGKILVMDDEDAVRMVCGDMLASFGFQVDYAKNGEEVIEKYKKGQYDLVIMDLTIPGGMGGKETIRELLNIDPHVRAIVSSGYSNDPVMANYESYGFRGVIVKPYRVEDLTATLQNVLKEGQS